MTEKTFSANIASIIKSACNVSKTIKLLKIAEAVILAAALINTACKTAEIIKILRK